MMRKIRNLLAGALLVSACYAQAPPSLEFEAASVKPGQSLPTSASCRGGPGTTDPGFYRCENWSLSNLIYRAYLLGPNQLSGPDWLGTANFDIVAKVPAGTTEEQFRTMLQNLLIDRFKLAVHHEMRDAPEYRLAVAKGGAKLKSSNRQRQESSSDVPKQVQFDEAGYPVCQPGESATKSTFTGKTRMCEPHATIEALAAKLSGYVHATVVNATGLTGEYAIDLYWVLEDSSTASADDTPGPTLIEAIQKQLGLRLEKSANGTKDVLVVDHAEKIPSAN